MFSLCVASDVRIDQEIFTVTFGVGGGEFCGQNMEIQGTNEGGLLVYMKFPLWWGYRYFLELHIKLIGEKEKLFSFLPQTILLSLSFVTLLSFTL